jgi:hypothetical protein
LGDKQQKVRQSGKYPKEQRFFAVHVQLSEIVKLKLYFYVFFFRGIFYFEELAFAEAQHS